MLLFPHMEVILELTKIRKRLQDQLRDLQVEVDAIDRTINVIEREDEKEGSVSESDEFSNTGFADGCRSIVGHEFIAPREVRDRLILGGFKHKDKTKVLSGVYATLKRLAGSNGPFESEKLNGKKAYRVKENPEQKAT